MSQIKSVTAIEILDSRGNPTLEVVCELVGGFSGLASVPSGASTGVHEACELRDKDMSRFMGLGVLSAVQNVNIEINENIKNKDFDQFSLDKALISLDGRENKSRLGANAILGVSLAFARACAKEKNKELFEYLGDLAGNTNFSLPQPLLNVINGGKHADSGLDVQEFMLIPVKETSFRSKIQIVAEVIHALKRLLLEKGYTVSVGDEGGFAPKLKSNEEAFEILESAIKKAGYSFQDVKIGIDVAASSFFENGVYTFKVKGVEKKLSSNEMIDWYVSLVNGHPITLIEDGLSEDDWDGFTELTKMLGEKIKIVGDDLTVTNVDRIKIAFEKRAINSVLIKLNQIGTLSETIEAIQSTKKAGWTPIISHRSGETTDTFIADLAVGLSCDFIKSGSLNRGERICKYNRLLVIESLLIKK